MGEAASQDQVLAAKEQAGPWGTACSVATLRPTGGEGCRGEYGLFPGRSCFSCKCDWQFPFPLRVGGKPNQAWAACLLLPLGLAMYPGRPRWPDCTRVKRAQPAVMCGSPWCVLSRNPSKRKDRKCWKLLPGSLGSSSWSPDGQSSTSSWGPGPSAPAPALLNKAVLGSSEDHIQLTA